MFIVKEDKFTYFISLFIKFNTTKTLFIPERKLFCTEAKYDTKECDIHNMRHNSPQTETSFRLK